MHLNPQDNTLQRSSTSTLSEVIYQVMSLNYGKLHLEILVKLILAKVTFQMSIKNIVYGWVKSQYQGNTILLLFWTFLRRLFVNEVYLLNFWSYDFRTLTVGRNSKSTNVCCKSTSLYQFFESYVPFSCSLITVKIEPNGNLFSAN